MTKTIITCDECKTEVASSRDICRVKVIFTRDGDQDYTYQKLREQPTKIKPLDLCNNCLNGLGIACVQKVAATMPEPPSLEAILRIIMREEAEEAIAANNQ